MHKIQRSFVLFFHGGQKKKKKKNTVQHVNDQDRHTYLFIYSVWLLDAASPLYCSQRLRCVLLHASIHCKLILALETSSLLKLTWTKALNVDRVHCLPDIRDCRDIIPDQRYPEKSRLREAIFYWSKRLYIFLWNEQCWLIWCHLGLGGTKKRFKTRNDKVRAVRATRKDRLDDRERFDVQDWMMSRRGFVEHGGVHGSSLKPCSLKCSSVRT